MEMASPYAEMTLSSVGASPVLIDTVATRPRLSHEARHRLHQIKFKVNEGAASRAVLAVRRQLN